MTTLRAAIVISSALALAALTGGYAADYPEVRAAANPTETTIGAPIVYTVTIAGKNIAGVTAVLPDKKEFFPKDLPGYVEPKKAAGKRDAAASKDEDPAALIPVCAVGDAAREDNSDATMRYQTIRVTVTFYRTGTFRLPEIELRGEDGIKIGYKVPEVTVKPVNEKGEFQEIEPPLELGGNYYRLIALVIALIVAAAAAVFIARAIARRRRRRAPAATVPPIERFMDDIHTLRTRGYVESGDVEAFCVELSSAFRTFLSGQFRAEAMEMTASEIVHYLETLPGRTTIGKYRDDIDRVLNLWDLMKFAEFVPSKEILEGNMESTVALAKKLAMEYRPYGAAHETGDTEAAR
ncbi:MAG TPA: hypothetical protein PKM65_17630 [Spirochaetota bacterium]|nr:hypothetical protein [Spirochaetota bacterium]HNT11285.1 hypothetical protein [Spirochaetota bacterium]